MGHRKREAYIAGDRAFFERGNYKNWNNFDYKDLMLRNRLAITFNTRHLPVSDGKDHTEFGGLLQEPPEWAKKPSPKKNPKRKSTEPPPKESAPKKRIKAVKEAAAASADIDTDDDFTMVMDPKTGLIVELCSLVD